MGWNRNDVDVVVINHDDQVIHSRIWLKSEKKELFCSFVYAHNKYVQRRTLWRSLCEFKNYVRNRPWSIMGDFNASLFLEDSTASGSNVDAAMREFRECVNEIEVMDVQRTGNLHANVTRLHADLDSIQTALDVDPFNVSLRETEAACVVEFNQAILITSELHV
ncbi:putative reverse transcriptase domain, reverse transcriptase zinc-binding domain protein [Tanacetum coccineum]